MNFINILQEYITGNDEKGAQGDKKRYFTSDNRYYVNYFLLYLPFLIGKTPP
ncbi:hypothetical protein LX24_00068 [Desulfallas thermosapovorans DSM 6562]|uniref:Uncharacterized protein n=1 Tax=Desulfallas thermosapovorans DSM 6562 TaxID=1121431 RepID=A0A5S4ZY51_9FIRM|nr:hypothetical protein LX24_00068 [Desulfallas thermosapovorans DSM 6562]